MSGEAVIKSASTSEYEEYVRTEWRLFVDDPKRAQVSLGALSGRSPSYVLDVGCGAGQELLPFAGASCCVGVDISPEVGRVGRELFLNLDLGVRVSFAQAIAEALPFRTEIFDAIICRLALPYTHNARALAEIARVLKPNGVLLLKIHHARYYLRKFWSGLLVRDLLSMVHASRVLVAGLVYHVTGRQVRTRLLSPETFQTKWLLRRELARFGLVIAYELPGSNPFTPFFRIEPRRQMEALEVNIE
jgi:SAM-dependent methyltransferase